VIAEGRFESALIANVNADHIFEVFAHPFTAGETIAQSRLGVLRVNGEPARASVVDVLGTGEYVLRLEVARPVTKKLALVAA
jgi:hypothetical protein